MRSYNGMTLLVVSDQRTEEAFSDIFQNVRALKDGQYNFDDHTVLLFEGGVDVNPQLYNEKRGAHTQAPNLARDAKEMLIFKKAQEAGAACIGVCRGSQFLTVMAGGKLIQHVTDHGSNHLVDTFDGEKLGVTSTHHQMCWPEQVDHTLIAWSTDRSRGYLDGYGVNKYKVEKEPEIIWYPKTRSLAIQGHPEYLTYYDRFPAYCRRMVRKFIFEEKDN